MRGMIFLLAALPFLPQGGSDVEVHFAPTGNSRLLEAEIAAEIGGARSEVLVAMFHFTSERLVRALAARRRAGVAVRVLLDLAQSDPDFVRGLRAGGLDVRRVVPRGGEVPRFHHKFCVIDSGIVVTGSYNWTVQGDRANHENVVILRDAEAARAFRANFEGVWADRELSQP